VKIDLLEDWDTVANLLIDLELKLFEEVRIRQRATIEKRINKLEIIKQDLLNKKLEEIPIKERTVNALFDDEIQGEDYEY